MIERFNISTSMFDIDDDLHYERVDNIDGNTDESVPLLIQQSLAVLRLQRNSNTMDLLLKISAFGQCQVERYQYFM